MKDKTKINNQDQIIIKNSNSYPNIDSEYKNSVKSIKDGFSIQGINKLKKSGTNADIYRILKLDYNTVEESNKNIEYSKEATRKELEERPIGGLGVFIIRKKMDSVQYKSEGDRGNILTMVKKRSEETG